MPSNSVNRVGKDFVRVLFHRVFQCFPWFPHPLLIIVPAFSILFRHDYASGELNINARVLMLIRLVGKLRILVCWQLRALDVLNG